MDELIILRILLNSLHSNHVIPVCFKYRVNVCYFCWSDEFGMDEWYFYSVNGEVSQKAPLRLIETKIP